MRGDNGGFGIASRVADALRSDNDKLGIYWRPAINAANHANRLISSHWHGVSPMRILRTPWRQGNRFYQTDDRA